MSVFYFVAFFGWLMVPAIHVYIDEYGKHQRLVAIAIVTLILTPVSVYFFGGGDE